MNEVVRTLPAEDPRGDWPVIRAMHGHTAGPLLSLLLLIILAAMEIALGLAIANRWQAGKSILILAALAFPVSLLCVVMVLRLLHGALALFLPRVEARSPRFAGRPSDRLYFSWSFVRPPSHVRELVISLEGYEERRRGSRHGDPWRKTVLFFQTIFTTSHPTSIAAGDLLVVIPYDAKTTRIERTHRIRWVVRVHGRMAFLPDLVETYEIAVLPLPKAVPNPLALLN